MLNLEKQVRCLRWNLSTAVKTYEGISAKIWWQRVLYLIFEKITTWCDSVGVLFVQDTNEINVESHVYDVDVVEMQVADLRKFAKFNFETNELKFLDGNN